MNLPFPISQFAFACRVRWWGYQEWFRYLCYAVKMAREHDQADAIVCCYEYLHGLYRLPPSPTINKENNK